MAQIPRVSGSIFNTAEWQEETKDLVYQAIKVGFRNFENGNHPSNYCEDLVGEGIRKAISEDTIDRSEIFVSLLCSFQVFNIQQSPIQLSSDPN
jgi:diketogulonate reductase-like aldo/keto reductase